MGDERTAFVLVASPRRDTLDEARYFLDRIRRADLDAAAVIVNRMLPRTGLSVAQAQTLHTSLADSGGGGAAQALLDLATAGEADDDRVADLASAAPNAVLATVPMLADDIHDIDGLRVIAELLTR